MLEPFIGISQTAPVSWAESLVLAAQHAGKHCMKSLCKGTCNGAFPHSQGPFCTLSSAFLTKKPKRLMQDLSLAQKMFGILIVPGKAGQLIPSTLQKTPVPQETSSLLQGCNNLCRDLSFNTESCKFRLPKSFYVNTQLPRLPPILYLPSINGE